MSRKSIETWTIGGRLKSGSGTKMVLIWILPENGIVSGAFVLTVPLTRIVFVEVRLAATAELSPHSRTPTTPMRRNDRNEASNERHIVMMVLLSKRRRQDVSRRLERHTLRLGNRRWQRSEERWPVVVNLPPQEHGVIFVHC